MANVLSNGLTNGAIYAIVALGFVLIYRNSGVFNFAHPQIGMMGGFMFFVLWVEQGWPYGAALVAAMALSAAIGLIVRQLLAPQESNPLNMLIGTLGVAGVLTWLAQDIWGETPAFVPGFGSGVDVEILGMHFRGPALLVLGALVVVVTVATAYYRYSRSGLGMRAVASDADASVLMGINVGLVSTLTWTVAGALAGLAAVMIAPFVNMEPFFMNLLFLRALLAALLARMTSLTGTVLAGLGIGVAEAYIIRETEVAGLPELALVALIILVLVARPASLGRRTA